MWPVAVSGPTTVGLTGPTLSCRAELDLLIPRRRAGADASPPACGPAPRNGGVARGRIAEARRQLVVGAGWPRSRVEGAIVGVGPEEAPLDRRKGAVLPGHVIKVYPGPHGRWGYGPVRATAFSWLFFSTAGILVVFFFGVGVQDREGRRLSRRRARRVGPGGPRQLACRGRSGVGKRRSPQGAIVWSPQGTVLFDSADARPGQDLGGRGVDAVFLGTQLVTEGQAARDTPCHSAVWWVSLVAGRSRPWCRSRWRSGHRWSDGRIRPIQPG